MKRLFLGLITTVMITSCSVQQFSVNSQVKPFEKGGRVFGERTEKCGEDGWKAEFKKDKDVHLLGVSIKNSNVSVMVEELQAKHYSIEIKSNLIVQILTMGLVDIKIVKVIKRDN